MVVFNVDKDELHGWTGKKARRRPSHRRELSLVRSERLRQIRREGPHLLHLFRRRQLLESFADEERLIAAPDQRRESALGHQPRRANVPERILFARSTNATKPSRSKMTWEARSAGMIWIPAADQLFKLGVTSCSGRDPRR